MTDEDGTRRGTGATAQAEEVPEHAAGDGREAARALEQYELALEREPADRYVMRLYIAGNSVRSRAAIENVRRVCTEYLCGRCDLEVIDIYQDEERGREDAILAAPTLVKFEPLPRSRIIGDMSRTEKLLAGLGLMARPG